MTSAIAVVGTDTGVGKTVVTRVLLDRLRALGKNVAAIKPFSTGGAGPGSDCAIIDPRTAAAAPASYQASLSPYGAIRRGEQAVSIKAVRVEVDRRIAGHEWVIVEGIGGVLVPLERGFTWLDLHAEYRWPAIVVGRSSLGTINHTLLTMEAIESRSIPIIGFVLNSPLKTDHDDMRENALIIAEFSGLVCLGAIRAASDPIEEVGRSMDWGTLESILNGGNYPGS